MLVFNEKRKHSRIEVSVPLRYKKLRERTMPTRGTITKNVSEGGVRFSTHEFVSLACRLVLELNIPTISKPIKTISKVAWIKKLPVNENYEVGNQFLDMSKEDREAISEYLKKA